MLPGDFIFCRSRGETCQLICYKNQLMGSYMTCKNTEETKLYDNIDSIFLKWWKLIFKIKVM